MPPKPEEYRYRKLGEALIPLCGCKKVRCSRCRKRYRREERHLDFCPDCGCDRYCTRFRIKDPVDPERWLPCRFHGGMSFKHRGLAHPSAMAGKYSKHLPPRLLTTYESAREDPDILSLNEEISLNESRIIDVLGRVDANESGALWDELARTAQEFKAARRAGNTERVGDLLEAMLKLIAKGKGDRENWREIGDLVERKRKLGESQLKLLTAKQEFISRQQAVLFVSQIIDVIKSAVDDPSVRRNIISGIQILANLPEGQAPGYTVSLKDKPKTPVSPGVDDEEMSFD